MSQSRHLETLLFWLMILIGGAALAPGLILPPWMERQAMIERHRVAQERVAALEKRVQTVEKQVDHLRNDPAYVLRLAEQEFGETIAVPDIETVIVAPSPDFEPTPPVSAAGADSAKQDILPELSALLDEVTQRYPRARVFVDNPSRQILMAMGAGLILTAIVLLGRGSPRPATTMPD